MRVPVLCLFACAAAITIVGCGGSADSPAQPTITAVVAGSLAKAAGDGQSAVAGQNVTVAPSVTLLDTRGIAMVNAPVTFTVAAGGGSVEGGAATTSAAGLATAGQWRLGPTPGANTLVATAAGLPPVTFSATGTADPCLTTNPIAFGAVASGALAASDCLLDDQYYGDHFAFTTIDGQRAQLDLVSTAFDPWLDLAGPLVTDYLAFDDNAGDGPASRIRLLAPPTAYIATVNSFAARQTGAYTFSVTSWSGDATGCEQDVWIVPSAVVMTQTAEATDCSFTGTGGPFFGDGFNFVAIGGRTYTITMSSLVVDPVLRVFDGITGAAIGVDNNSGGGTAARISWTPAVSTTGVVFATTAVGSTTGAYSLVVAGPATRSASSSASGAAIRLPVRGRAVRRPASGAAGAPWVFPRVP
ncbi:MAG: hypothetical protein P3A28_05365 [Gemmatimonadota bacterium]|nr:hypothetical protein [Gemmatimonadota bacterium]